MYNGVGLTSARGSGTNGFVQSNLSHIATKRERVEYRTDDDLKKLEAALAPRSTHPEILEHERKRQIELRCMELRDQLEEQG